MALPVALWLAWLVQARPDPFVEAFDEGRKLLEDSRATDAEARFRRALELRPGDGGARYFLGVALLKQGRTEEAAGELEQAKAIWPRNAAVLFELGNAYLRLEDVEAARRSYHQALRLDAGKADVHVALGRALVRLNRVEEAEGSAASMDPEQAEARYQLGLLALERGAEDDAARAFEEALRSNPRPQSACYNLRLLLLQRRADVERATELLDRFREILAENQSRARARTAISREPGR